MSLRDQKPGHPVSARALRDVARAMGQQRPTYATGSPLLPRTGDGGSGVVDDSATIFVAEVTDRTPSDESPGGYRYAVREVWLDQDDGSPTPKPAGRESGDTGEVNYALPFADEAYCPGDLVGVRRHQTRPSLFEILFRVTGDGECASDSDSSSDSSSDSESESESESDDGDGCCVTVREWGTPYCSDGSIMVDYTDYQICLVGGCLVKTAVATGSGS